VFDHVAIRVSDGDASRRFYTLALGEPGYDDGEWVLWHDFGLVEGADVARRLHVAFGVPDRAAVDAWWRRLVDAGYTSDGEPGARPQYNETYYGAFVLDPDGHSVEAVHHQASVAAGIDHLWLRTRDVAAAKRFYETVAPVLGLRLVHDSPDRVRFAFTGRPGSFTFVGAGEPTEHVHVAFSVPDLAAVEAFHAAALAAGYEDNGGPGERPQSAAGYYGAFVLDPDGHNVEAVFHAPGPRR
jgi:catechol 2,3-dioxygenase-like lactoylglutathione lyase family enzyme